MKNIDQALIDMIAARVKAQILLRSEEIAYSKPGTPIIITIDLPEHGGGGIDISITITV